jgi:spore maturation protein CgeB
MDTLRVLAAPAELFVTGMAANKGFSRTAMDAVAKLQNFLAREPERLKERELLHCTSRFAPDLILVLHGNHLSPKTVALLRKVTRAPIVCWCQDHLATMGRQYLLGAGYDVIFVKDRYMLELFSSMVRDTHFHYLPEACNPRVHRPIELSPADQQCYRCEVMVYGSLYYYRQEILRQLGEFDLKIWGYSPSWLVNCLKHRFAGGEVLMDDKVRAVRAARIALNTLHYAEVNSLNCRAFELAGCGAFQLITQRNVLSEHFIVGEELDSFSSVDDLIDKIRYYLERPELTAQIAQRAHVRAHSEHSYERRLQTIFDVALSRVQCEAGNATIADLARS